MAPVLPTAHPRQVTVALRQAGRGATVVLLGLPPTGKTSTIHADEVVYNDLTVGVCVCVCLGKGWG
jgi:hypothetical protein